MTPREEYQKRQTQWQAERNLAERLFIRIGNWRLLLGIIEAVLAYLVFGPHLVPVWLLLLPALAFIALAAWHSRVMRRRTLADRALRFYGRALTRLDDRWQGTGNTGDRFADSSHVYSGDLDLFGKGSLFELISNTRTAAGENTLADWLLAPASLEEVLARQSAIKELQNRLDLREDLALLGSDIQADVHVDALRRWGTAPPVIFPPVLRPIAALLGALGLVLLVEFFAQKVPFWLLAGVAGVNVAIGYWLRSRVRQVLEAAETAAGHGLDVLSLILERLERESFQSPYLQNLRKQLVVEGKPASARIAQLGRWIDWLHSSDHSLLRAIGPVVLLFTQLALGIENWRRCSGQHVSQWLNAVAELEALSSFASLAFEHPGWSFPALNETGSPCFEACDLQHPLLPESRSVPNDLAFTGDLKLLIVSGSNMSGKSTLLRAVGLNCVLAWAGAPVAARRLRLSPLQIGASIRVTDSLLDNRSRFFAEISRIRQIVDLTKKNRPVLFLLDELLSGTNSHDRRIGAAAIIHKLIQSQAIGLVTTHDLALAHIQQDLNGSAQNVHFDDRIVSGQIEFDYRLKPGVVTHSNALELMRAVGLEV
ncbi:MAG: mismatch repair protein [Acidobacteriaceae bacterium]|nr:mismatch repair protein [Acidobacteriaceae bacterium]